MAFKAKKADVGKIEYTPPNDNNGMTAIIDGDCIKYAVAHAAAKRSIKITHKTTGKEVLDTNEDGEKVPFNTRTEFWGRKKNVIEGRLGEWNEGRKVPFCREDFDVEDIVEADDVSHALHSCKATLLRHLESSGCRDYILVLGEGTSFRENISSLQKYKGNRPPKPPLLEDIEQYMVDRMNTVRVSGIEADDKVVMLAYGHEDRFVLGEDKDARSQPVKIFDINRPEQGVIDCNCLGKIEYLNKGSYKKVEGYGRLFLLWQMLAGDSVDTFKPTTHSDKKLGDKGAYDVLANCKDDQEALQAAIGAFKELYPEPKEITTWRGNKITVDWYYVANEMFALARMMRFEGDIMGFDKYCYDYGVMF